MQPPCTGNPPASDLPIGAKESPHRPVYPPHLAAPAAPATEVLIAVANQHPLPNRISGGAGWRITRSSTRHRTRQTVDRAHSHRGWAGRERRSGLCRAVAQSEEGGIHSRQSSSDRPVSQVRSSPARTVLEKLPRHRLQEPQAELKSPSWMGICLGHPPFSKKMGGDQDQAPFFTSNVEGVTLIRITRTNPDGT